MEEKEVNTIDIAQLGAEIGMEAKEQTLPNGKVVKSVGQIKKDDQIDIRLTDGTAKAKIM